MTTIPTWAWTWGNTWWRKRQCPLNEGDEFKPAEGKYRQSSHQMGFYNYNIVYKQLWHFIHLIICLPPTSLFLSCICQACQLFYPTRSCEKECDDANKLSSTKWKKGNIVSLLTLWLSILHLFYPLIFDIHVAIVRMKFENWSSLIPLPIDYAWNTT